MDPTADNESSHDRITPVPRDGGLRILVPLDDSSQAQRVLPYVTRLAAATDSKLKLIRATDIEDESSFNSLAQNAERLREAGIVVESTVVSGVDAETAIHNAELAWQPDLIALASVKSSPFERWLSGSVTEQVVKSARVPILVVPPNWERPITQHEIGQMLVALDGSPVAEQTLGPVLHLASIMPMDLVLLRAIDHETARQGAEEYLRQVATRIQEYVADRQVSWRCVRGPVVRVLVEAARDLDVDVMAMATRGHTTGRRAGRTVSEVFDRASLPMVLVGTGMAATPRAAEIRLGAEVRGLDGRRVGEVHRVVVDLKQQAVVSVVVLERGGLVREVLVPADFVERVEDGQLELRLQRDALEQFPNFTYNELETPPPLWDLPSVGSTRERKRLRLTQVDVNHRTSLLAADGEVGRVAAIELDLATASLRAFWVRADAMLGRTVRVPAEWVRDTDEHGNLRVSVTRAQLDGYVGRSPRVSR